PLRGFGQCTLEVDRMVERLQELIRRRRGDIRLVLLRCLNSCLEHIARLLPNDILTRRTSSSHWCGRKAEPGWHLSLGECQLVLLGRLPADDECSLDVVSYPRAEHEHRGGDEDRIRFRDAQDLQHLP